MDKYFAISEKEVKQLKTLLAQFNTPAAPEVEQMKMILDDLSDFDDMAGDLGYIPEEDAPCPEPEYNEGND